MTGETVLLRVEEIGARGAGIARHEGERVFLPLTAPGEVVRARPASAGPGAQRGSAGL